MCVCVCVCVCVPDMGMCVYNYVFKSTSCVWQMYIRMYVCIAHQLEEQALQSQQRLAEARKEASEVVIEAAKKQLENAHNLATQTAVSAAKAAVKAVLHQQSSKEDNYSSASAFEDISTDTTRGSETTTKDSEDVSVEQVVTDGESSVKDEAE